MNSCGHSKHFGYFRCQFTMLKAIGQNPKDERFNARYGLLASLAISQRTGNGGNFRYPATV